MAFAHSIFVLIVLASSVANAFRSKKSSKALMESVFNLNITSAKLPFPKIYTKIMDPIQFLGAGSFGQAWLVKDLQPKSPRAGQLIVMKLLYITQSKKDKYLTWERASTSKLLRKEVVAAAKECEISKMMQEEAEKSDHPGAMRIMNCYGHNAPVMPNGAIKAITGQSAKRPLYLLLENCGATDLTKFMRGKAIKGEVDLPLVQNLYKQLMEGLSFLRQLPNPWVHHDLKPDNIVVKTQRDGTYSLHLIDFGASTETTASKPSKMTPSTGIYAPNEWGVGGNFGWCPGSHSSKPDGNCGTAFDIFSAGAIFVELVTGAYLADLPGFYDSRRDELAYSTIERVTKNTGKFELELSTRAKSAYRATTNELVSTWAPGFLPVVASQLTKEPAYRPTADHIMESDFLSVVATPADMDYMALKKQKMNIDAAAASGEDVVEVGRKFKLADKVLVFSNTAQAETGNGWCVGYVEKLIPGNKVLVVFSLAGAGAVQQFELQKELEDSSEYLRPFVFDVEDEHDRIDGDNEFKPSSGGKAGGLLADEVQEEENSHCPSWCDECDIAMNDRGTLKGHRRTLGQKWASICYVNMLKKVRPPDQGNPENGGYCQMGATETVGKKRFQTYLCQDLDLLHVKPQYSPDNWKQYVK